MQSSNQNQKKIIIDQRQNSSISTLNS